MRKSSCFFIWVEGFAALEHGPDLGTALTVFFNGGPERFNYMAKHEVPSAHRGAARVLDNICLRVNSGFYRVRPGRKVARRARIERWLAYQHADREEGSRGRWILDEAVVEAALKGRPPQAAGAMRDAEALRPLRGGGPAHTLWSRLVRRGPARQLRRFLPSRGS